IAKAQQQGLQVQLQVLNSIRAQYQAYYNDQTARETAFVSKLNDIDKTRIAFSDDLEQKLRDIRNEGLSGYDAYIEKTNQINDLIGKARTAFEQGGEAGVELGKKYTEQAISLAGSITKVINNDGIEVVTSFQAQQEKLTLTKQAGDQYLK